MGPVSVLIKPASGNCNLRCRYCFYRGLSDNLELGLTAMERETAEKLIDRCMEANPTSLTFAFQGGEPTLAGLQFFRDFVAYVKKQNQKPVPVSYALQTNGQKIDREWAEFLQKEHFLVGLSMDGERELHDYLRPDPQGKGSYAGTERACSLFQTYGVDFNILCVVSDILARHPERIYDAFRKKKLGYLQFIPCLNPLEGEGEHHAPGAKRLGDFYIRLFDRWYRDFMAGEYVSIRWFDNLLHMSMGEAPEQCGLFGYCPGQLVVEADGSVYPCDFYVADCWKMGNLKDQGLEELAASQAMQHFVESSFAHEKDCEQCEERYFCRGGCRRDRDMGEQLGKSRLCQAYKAFFPRWRQRLPAMLERLNRYRRENGGARQIDL